MRCNRFSLTRFQYGKANGLGMYTYASGDVYQGEFKDDRFHGQGTYRYANGFVFTGLYSDGEMQRGQWTSVDGESKYFDINP